MALQGVKTMADETSAGFQGLIQVDKGQTGTFTEVGDVVNAPPELSKDELDDTAYADGGRSRLQGLADGSISVECNLDYGNQGQIDLLNAWDDGALVDVEMSPNSRDTDATTLVITLAVKVFNVSFGTGVADKVTVTFELMNADGSEPAFAGALT